MKSLPYLLLLFLSLWACKDKPAPAEPAAPVIGTLAENAMVVSAREEASKIGVEILKKGGNAFDAMVATEMALAVAYPYAGNLGGGGFMVYRTQYGEIGALDYREKAPLAAERDMYLDSAGNYLSEKSKVGALAVGVPGTVAGIFAVHQKLGTLPMEELLRPVIALARNGYVVTEKQAGRFEQYASVFEKVNEEASLYTLGQKAGDTIKNEALAATLERLADKGRSEFYQGETAEKLVAFLQSKNGIITLEDLDAYEAQWREPVQFTYKGLNIISMSPPSSGGVCLAQIMKMVEPYDLSEYGHNSTKSIQLLAEAERRAYADRSYYLGDPDFVEIPLDTLISEGYAVSRMENFTFQAATPSSEVTHGNITMAEAAMAESMETTHYSIVDAFGNAIAVTTTLNGAYGSKLYAKELGFFLNNEMDDFSAKPGTPNMFGLIGGEANAIEPQKRMLSSMTPTLIEKEGAFWMSVGTPGGSTIITSVLQTILNVYEYDMSMQEAVNAPRFHHQWLPDIVMFEPDSFPQPTLDSLSQLGYTIDVNNAPVIGKVDAILRLPDGTLEGGADRRGDDTAVGY
ncbi:gamma-glutamyltransferase [Altibacter sp. HG106]|uniref:gamma-glutamyltransferase n=1 Tax=Altibacter sp. HG106 TaxID=3023937 RepID=UPI0023507003|nr:gamma-glutamyltransferase [Altibacter sp. HG106]MDC7995384.1 gamma-glutamyltransferase [Altibacter sp. HG106]